MKTDKAIVVLERLRGVFKIPEEAEAIDHALEIMRRIVERVVDTVQEKVSIVTPSFAPLSPREVSMSPWTKNPMAGAPLRYTEVDA